MTRRNLSANQRAGVWIGGGRSAAKAHLPEARERLGLKIESNKIREQRTKIACRNHEQIDTDGN
jgi:hypothetical protein